MGKKKWQSGISMALTAVLAVGSVFFAAPVPIQAKAMESGRELTIDGSEIAGDLVKAASKTYYIDAKDGNDSNDGTSEAKAWKSFANLKELKLTEDDMLDGYYFFNPDEEVTIWKCNEETVYTFIDWGGDFTDGEFPVEYTTTDIKEFQKYIETYDNGEPKMPFFFNWASTLFA